MERTTQTHANVHVVTKRKETHTRTDWYVDAQAHTYTNPHTQTHTAARSMIDTGLYRDKTCVVKRPTEEAHCCFVRHTHQIISRRMLCHLFCARFPLLFVVRRRYSERVPSNQLSPTTFTRLRLQSADSERDQHVIGRYSIDSTFPPCLQFSSAADQAAAAADIHPDDAKKGRPFGKDGEEKVTFSIALMYISVKYIGQFHLL